MLTKEDVVKVIAGRTAPHVETLMAVTLEKIDGLEGMSVDSIHFDEEQNALQATLQVDLPEVQDAS